MRGKLKDTGATILGVIMAMVSCVEFIDFDNFDVCSINQWMKLIIALSPVLAGYTTEFKGKTLNDAATESNP